MRWEIVQTGGTLCAIDPSTGVAAHGGSASSGYVVASFATTGDAYRFLGSAFFEPSFFTGASVDGRVHCVECVVALANWGMANA